MQGIILLILSPFKFHHYILKRQEFLKFYINDPFIRSIAEIIKPNEGTQLQLKSLSGSLDAIVAAAIHQLNHQTSFFILQDKEEAAYFHTDLQSIMGEKEVLFFPTSYKKPYSFEETENANILQRTEILNRILHKSSAGEMIVSYPDAITEKVINKVSLNKNTYNIKVEDEIDLEFLTEFLISYDFEKTDFVFEAGQFSIRGGIVDIFSFGNELPFRIELFGDEVDSIRTFNPDNQLSVAKLRQINIIPNVQTKLWEEERQSILEFLPAHSKIWIKDYDYTVDLVEKYYYLANENFEDILKESANTQVVLSPDNLFVSRKEIIEQINKFPLIEFGSKFKYKDSKVFTFNSSPQISYNKNFEMLAEAMEENSRKGITNIFVSESQQQLDKLYSIFSEIAPDLKIHELVASIRGGFIDNELKLACFTDHQLFERFHRYKTKQKYTKSKALTLKELKTLSPGDYVTHIEYGIGRFAGLEQIDHNGNKQEAIRLVYKDDDLLYVNVQSLHKISKYSGKEGAPPNISKLGTQEWENKKRATKKKVKDIAKDLINLYAKRKSAPGFSFSRDSFLQAELETSFIYEDTPDQAKSTDDVKKDMELAHPMDRLVCGDVGFGKTEVAIRAAFKAVTDNKQVAVLVPTTILAFQHFRTFKGRLKNFPVAIDYLNRFRTTKESKEIFEKIKDGSINIIIGTHRLVNKAIDFKNLGLLIIDEEQKFGVKIKDRLKELRVNVDVLTLTATPIPRTLHFSLMGARDLSVISTPPPNRQPVTTEIHTFNKEVIRDAIVFEIKRGGQVFFVHNRVKDIDEIANIIMKLVPDVRIGVAHGQMEGHRLEKVMLRFIEGEYDILVSTNIIESGLDIPNANTIIINQAHFFGLSDLHQMRGRVGRSNKKAFCYLLAPPSISLSSEAIKRLKTLEEFSDLGDGFKVAMRDLDIRGAGNLLGAEQSGFINDLGFDAYHKILDEAVKELKETEFKDLFKNELAIDAKKFVVDCNIETDFEVIIPDSYVSNISERLQLYNQLDNIESESKLEEFIRNTEDRFGKLVQPVKDLIEIVKIRWIAEKLGFEKVIIKNETIKGYFISSENKSFFQSEVFGTILSYIQRNSKNCKLKETKTRLIFIQNEITSINKAVEVFQEISGNN